jgi:hypothetical protein
MQITFIRESERDCAIRCVCADGTVLAVRTYSRPLGLPHDLAHYVVERELGLAWGFWGLVAAGAPFASVTQCGGHTRRHHYEEGQWLIKQHRDDLAEAEALVGVFQSIWHGSAWDGWRAQRAALAGCWRRPDITLDRNQVVRVCGRLSQMETQWLSLGCGEALTVDWPTVHDGKRRCRHPAARRPPQVQGVRPRHSWCRRG